MLGIDRSKLLKHRFVQFVAEENMLDFNNFQKDICKNENFRLVVLPVEASLPPIQEKEVESSAEEIHNITPRISRDELYEDLAEGSKLNLIYVIMVALSTIVAAIGLIRNDVTIIIGAMLIAPLLSPNVALALACVLGHRELAKHSLKTIATGIAIACVLSIILGSIFEIDPNIAQIASRTHVGLSDLILALIVGTAGALSFTTGVSSVVVGVMVAVALLPPLVVTGLLLGAGNARAAFGSLMLIVMNVTCINLSAMLTFLAQKIRPRTWWEEKRAHQASRTAAFIWIGMLIILIGLILLNQYKVSFLDFGA